MTLQSELAAASVQAGLLEAEVNALKATVVAQLAEIQGLHDEIDDLETKLAELTGHHDSEHHGVEPPQPDPDPLPQPEPWPSGGIVVKPGDDIGKIVAANSAGATFRFTPGTYVLTGSLPLKGGNKYIADDPKNRPKLVGPGANGSPFATATVGGVVLKGLDISQFGRANSTEGGSMINKADGDNLGVNWLIEDCNIGNTNNGGIRWGPGWTIRRTRLHDCGRYALHGGGMTGTKLLEDCEFVHIGYVAPDYNRGGTKFAVTKGIVIRRLWTHDIKGSGLWFDIKNEDGILEDVTAEDCTRMGINFEVSYGSFQVTNPIMRRCGSDKKSSEGAAWPIPGGMQLSMTPDVTVTNPLVEDCRNGITVIQWAHPQVTGQIGSLDPTRCGNENIVINGGKITKIQEWSAGLAGNRPAKTRPTKNIHWKNVQFDPGAKFRSELDIP